MLEVNEAIRVPDDDSRSYTIVGVMPAGFQTHGRVDLWTPLRPNTTGEGGGTNYGIITRLKPGAS